MRDQTKIVISALSLSCFAASLGGAVACQDKGDRFNPIELDLCPRGCTNCLEDDEEYTCHMWIFNAARERITSWTGVTCAPPNLHPDEVPFGEGLDCGIACDTYAKETYGAGAACGVQYEIYENEETGNLAIDWRLFQDGPLCDSSLNGTDGGGPVAGGSGGALVCEGDSGTGAYDEEPPEAECPEWFTPGTLVASTPASSKRLDVNIDADFVDRLKQDNFAPLVCDAGRYMGGQFVALEPGDLFHELGFRNNDSDLEVVRVGASGSPKLPWFGLDDPLGISQAVFALHDKPRMRFRVKRSGTPNGKYTIQVNIIECGSGACPAP